MTDDQSMTAQIKILEVYLKHAIIEALRDKPDRLDTLLRVKQNLDAAVDEMPESGFSGESINAAQELMYRMFWDIRNDLTAD